MLREVAGVNANHSWPWSALCRLPLGMDLDECCHTQRFAWSNTNTDCSTAATMKATTCRRRAHALMNSAAGRTKSCAAPETEARTVSVRMSSDPRKITTLDRSGHAILVGFRGHAGSAIANVPAD